MKVLLLGALLFAALSLLTSTYAEIPTHVHLFLTGNLSTLQVSFVTSTIPAAPGVIYWQTEVPSHKYEVLTSKSDVHSFTRPLTGVVDHIASITLTSLASSVSYSYYVFTEKGNSTTFSKTYSFNALPPDDSTINIGLYGDLGAYGSAIEATGSGGLGYWASNHKFDFIVHNGDLAYNLGTSNGAVGVNFLNSIEKVTSIVPYMVTPGNHEFMEESEYYYNNWFLGQAALGVSSGSSDAIMWYSFDIGRKLHIVAISTEVYCEDKSNLMAQHAWLKRDLAAVRARAVQPWIIVFGHRQIYIGSISSLHSRLMRLGLQCTDSTLTKCDFATPCVKGVFCGYSIEQLFDEYKVDIYFAGHVHTYNRMYPIGSNLTFETQKSDIYYNPQRTVYVVSGAAGTQSSPPNNEEESMLASPTAVGVDGYTFSFLQVNNNTHLSLTQIDVTTGTTKDAFSIVKDPAMPPWKATADFTLDSDSQTVCDQ